VTSPKLSALVFALLVGCSATAELELLSDLGSEVGPDEDGGRAGGEDGTEPDGAEPDEADPDGAAIARADGGTDASVQAKDATAAGDMVLRYDFSGSGTELVDRVGRANARLLGGAQLGNAGSVWLDGDNDYVDLPNGVLSRLSDATIVVWFELDSDPQRCWERVFDFGSSDGGEGTVGRALTSLFFTPRPCGGEMHSLLMAEFAGEQGSLPGRQLSAGRTIQIAVTFEARRDATTLYQDGAFIEIRRTGFALAKINDVNNWLGRSQWSQDRYARIRYDEFRIYNRALRASEIAELARRGPDAVP
jgi:hypothetical protein